MGASYNGKAYEVLYKHASWEKEARNYEDHFAANLYKSPYVQEAAKTALAKLSRMLNAYYGAGGGNPEQVQDVAATAQLAGEMAGERVEITDILSEALLAKGDSSRGAGQVGSAVSRLAEGSSAEALVQAKAQDREMLNAVINEDGNLREQMTLLYNGLFINGGRTTEEIEQSHSLKNMMAYMTEADKAKGGGLENVRLDVLNEMGQRQKHGDVFDTFSIARDMKRYTDKIKQQQGNTKKDRGNVVTRFFSGIKRAFSAALSSKFTRSSRKRMDLGAVSEGDLAGGFSARELAGRGLGEQHYNDLGIGLSERERANGVRDGELQWKEGSSWYKMNESVSAEGMVQTAGPSGTTLRMLSAYKLMGASKAELMKFRLALIAWMVTSHDHSLYEILKGSHNAGVVGTEDLTEPAKMYPSVDPLPVDVIRAQFAPNHEFPHEKMYKIMLNELRDKRKANHLAILEERGMTGELGKREKLKEEKKLLTEEIEKLKERITRVQELKAKGENYEEDENEQMLKTSAQVALSMAITRGDADWTILQDLTYLTVDEMMDQGTFQDAITYCERYGQDGLKQKIVEGMAAYRAAGGKSGPKELPDVGDLYKQQMQMEERLNDINIELVQQNEGFEKVGYDPKRKFSLYFEDGGETMEGLDEDAMHSDAYDLALNVYTTSAYLAMNRGQQYGSTLSRMGLKNSRTDRGGLNSPGMGSYFNSSNREMNDKELSQDIYDMVRVSSRMAQDALEERGSNAPDSEEPVPVEEGEDLLNQNAGKKAFIGTTFRGARIKGYMKASEGSTVTVDSLTSSSKDFERAKKFYEGSCEKHGEDNAVLIQYAMKGKGSVDISGSSAMAYEQEVLIAPNSKFKVVRAMHRNVIYENGIGLGVFDDEDEYNQYGNVLLLEEVDGPGARKRETKRRLTEMHRRIRDMYRPAAQVH